MTKKRNSLKTIILVIAALEIILLVVSGGLNKKLEIGFESGKFLIKSVDEPYVLQEKITEDFQPDQYLHDQIIQAVNIGEEITGEIYGSEKIYDFFAAVFGSSNAINAFRLIRILLIVNLIFLFIIISTKKRIAEKPSKIQILFEMLYSFFDEFVRDTLGKKNLHFTPYIVTIFLFIWICNMIGLVPIPGFMEPTRNLNVPLALGIIAMVVVHAKAIKVKGLGKHLLEYTPVKNPLFILDIVGEVSKVVSISFRLFGNILGGAIIILVVSSLVKFFILPVGLSLFFGIFVGSIQAFVFTMLALTYIGVEIGE